MNVRYMLNDLRCSPQRICERIHGKRGYAENRLKELKAGPGVDRTCRCKFAAKRGACLGQAEAERLRGCPLKLAA